MRRVVVDASVLLGWFEGESPHRSLRAEYEAGTLAVEETTEEPVATLTCAGLSALAYGVLDPVEVVLRGFGRIEEDGLASLGALFPRQLPYLFADL